MFIVYKWFVSCALVCLLLSGSAMPAMAQSASSPNGQALQTLESKFFEHTYPNDTEEDRIARLEKLIFGETKSGDVQSRLADIQKVVSTNEAGSAKSSTTASSSSSGSSSTSSPANATSDSSGSGSETAASVPPSSASYPRVDALEELMLGRTNKTTPLEKRLATLEKKAFGHPSTSDDMSARTDSLEQYWQKSLSATQNQKYDHALTQLEAQVIGQSYPDKPMIERLQTLEGIVFPNEPPDTHASIKEQLDTLANAVQISQKQGRKPSVNGAADTAQTAGGYPDASQTAVSNAPGQYGSYGQSNPNPYNSSQSGNYNAQTGYANTDHAYPGQSASSSYGSQGQYTNPTNTNPTNTTTAQAPPNNYGQITPFANSPTTNESYGGSSGTQQKEKPKSQGHPLLKGLAKALGTAAEVAGMAVGAMGTGMMYSGMGGYGMGGYGMGGYGMSPYGMGMGGYGMGGMGMGMGGYGMGGMGMGGYGMSPYGMGGLGRW